MYVKTGLILGILILFLNGCSSNESISGQEDETTANINIYFEKPSHVGSKVTSAEAVVTAVDMDSIRSTLTVTDSSVYGLIEHIPAGPDRKFEIYCYDSDLIVTYYGYNYLDVNAGQVHDLDIDLSNSGAVNIGGTFPAEDSGDGKIVFQADYEGNDDIYIMNPDGTNIRRLTTSEGNDIRPRISPDRTKILFCSNRSGLMTPYMMNMDGSNLVKYDLLPGKDIGSCDWSPDNNILIFHGYEDQDSDIFIYDLDKEARTKVTDNDATDWIPHSSPGGDLIAFFSNLSGPFKAYLCNSDGSDIRLLTPDNSSEQKAPSFSPDGSKIVMYARDAYPQWGIFMCDTDGSNYTELLNTPGIDETLCCFSPDGNSILYQRYDGGTNGHGLYVLDIGSGNVELLLDNAGNERYPHWY